jgi:hypothetical protein
MFVRVSGDWLAINPPFNSSMFFVTFMALCLDGQKIDQKGPFDVK